MSGIRKYVENSLNFNFFFWRKIKANLCCVWWNYSYSSTVPSKLKRHLNTSHDIFETNDVNDFIQLMTNMRIEHCHLFNFYGHLHTTFSPHRTLTHLQCGKQVPVSILGNRDERTALTQWQHHEVDELVKSDNTYNHLNENYSDWMV